jgi:hypothetical protein
MCLSIDAGEIKHFSPNAVSTRRQSRCGTIALDAPRRPGKSGACVALQSILDREGEFAVEAFCDKSRLVVGHASMITRSFHSLAGYPQRWSSIVALATRPDNGCSNHSWRRSSASTGFLTHTAAAQNAFRTDGDLLPITSAWQSLLGIGVCSTI